MTGATKSPFASRNVATHLLRGLVAAVLIALAVAIHITHPWLAGIAGLAAVVMLRGCPLCWTVGLFETLR